MEWGYTSPREVNKGVIEAAKAMGAKTSTIIMKVLLPESMPALISGITVTAIALVGYTAMAGVISIRESMDGCCGTFRRW